ncbi:MAG: MMPL family transporter [Archaeoglobi archaeon]|nr:MMPL family transporter [Candidatus Mnemosynella bozhongmuii]
MFSELLGRIAEFIAEKPGVIVSITAVILIISAISASNVEFGGMDYEEFFPPGDEVYTQNILYEKNFGVEESAFIFIKADDVVKRDIYEYMLELEENLRELDEVRSTISPASIITELNNGTLPDDETLLRVLSEKYASGLLPEDSMALIMVQLSTGDEEKVAEELERAVDFIPKPAGVTVELTGTPMLQHQITQETQENLRFTSSLSIVFMILILFITFSGAVRRKLTAFIPLLISIFTVLILVGYLPLLGVRITSIISATIPILIGLAIEYSAQIQSRYEEERRDGKDRDEAVVLSVTRTGIAVVMAMLTTVIGFLSMAAPRIPTLAWFGIIMSAGLMIAYVLSVTFLPAILKCIDRGAEKVSRREDETGVLERVLEVISEFTASNPRKILAIAIILILLGSYASTGIKLETDTKKYAPSDLPAMVRFRELERVAGGQYIFTLVLSVDEVNVETLRKADELANYIVEKEELVYRYDSLSSLMKQFLGRIPESDTELQYILSRVPEEQLTRYLSGNLIAINFYSNADTHDERVDLWRNIEEDVRFFGWSGDFYLTGSSVIMAHLGEVMRGSQRYMTAVAYFLIVILLFSVYRSLTRALTPLVAITTVIGATNLFMYLLGIKQTMISIALNSIILGLGIDFSIHVTERYFEERERYSPIDSVRRTIERTGKAIVTSALTMAGGFGATSFSTFPALSDFGILALIAIFFSLFSALTVVPAFLMISERFRNRGISQAMKNFQMTGNIEVS